jgi:hypothetical protein
LLKARTSGWLFDTIGVAQKRASASRRILLSGVGEEGARPNARIELAFLVAHERK